RARGSGRENGSCDPADWSDPVLRTYDDAAAWLGKLWSSKWRQVEVDGQLVNLPEGGVWGYLYRRMNHQGWARQKFAKAMQRWRGTFRLSKVVQAIRRDVELLDDNPQNNAVRKLVEDWKWPTLEDVNLKQAAAWAAGMLQVEEGREAIRQFADALDAKEGASDEQRASLAAAAVAEMATGACVEFNRYAQAHAEIPDAAENMPAVIARAREFFDGRHPAPSGSGSIFSEFLEDVGDWGGNVIREAGKGISRFAQNILNVEDSVPWLSQFVLRPSFIMSSMQLLKQVGNAMQENRTSAFDAKQLGLDFGRDLSSWGTALVVASPFIPQPYGALAAAAGALAVAGGGLIQEAVTPESTLNTGKLGQDRVSRVDKFGREIAEDGLPLDPYQRQAELQRRATLGPDPDDQVAGEWRPGADGLVYGWHQLGTENWYWLALALDPQQRVSAAWAWTGEQWGALA
ncbi:MAG: hypothetical protein ACOC93_04760, partial [Planctomycetota bacterium]